MSNWTGPRAEARRFREASEPRPWEFGALFVVVLLCGALGHFLS